MGGGVWGVWSGGFGVGMKAILFPASPSTDATTKLIQRFNYLRDKLALLSLSQKAMALFSVHLLL